MDDWGIRRVANPGAELKRWRTRRRLSLRALANRVNCDFSHLGKIENGKVTFTEEMARACDRALDAGGALIRAWSAAQGMVRPAQLPPAPPRLVGRDGELAVLARGMTERTRGKPNVVAIDGPAGVGKTSVALWWAHQIADTFVDGQLYADLGGFAPPNDSTTAHVVLGRFLTAVGASWLPDTTAERAALYRSLMAERHVLIVLDNVPDATDVDQLVPGSDRCAVVVTSRRALSPLVTRAGATRVTLRPLAEADSVTMVSHMIDLARAAAEPDAVTTLARLCGHLPLVLSAAAERIAEYPDRRVHDLVEELLDDKNRLSAWQFADVRTAFSWTYRVLPPDAARLFRLIGLHPDPYLHVAAVAALADITVPQARRLLHQLASLHLVEVDADDMIQIHDLLHAYAGELVDAEEDDQHRRDARRRLVSWYESRGQSSTVSALRPDTAGNVSG